jgi:hypothetical protein
MKDGFSELEPEAEGVDTAQTAQSAPPKPSSADSGSPELVQEHPYF